MKLYVADAFTARPFSGNQAGVALLWPGEAPPDGDMRQLAAELHHSETAFVRQVAGNAFQIRYFTASGEVDLCGHATIAAFTVLREEGIIGTGSCRLLTRAGELEVSVSDAMIWMDMARPEEIRTFSRDEAALLYAAYGLTPDDGPEDMEPAIVSSGLRDILLPVATLEALARAVQNEAEVIRISRSCSVTGVHMFWYCPGQEETAHCRNFAPLYAIPEESATGTSNGALTLYLHRRGKIASGKENRFLQGEQMGRPSAIFTRLEEGGGSLRIRVGGQAVVVFRLERYGIPETAG